MRNNLLYVKRLEQTGLTREQAETQVEIMTEIIQVEIATKHDLVELEGRLDRRILGLEAFTKGEVSRLEHRMTEMEFRLTTRLGSIMVIGIGVIATLIKFV